MKCLAGDVPDWMTYPVKFVTANGNKQKIGKKVVVCKLRRVQYNHDRLLSDSNLTLIEGVHRLNLQELNSESEQLVSRD